MKNFSAATRASSGMDPSEWMPGDGAGPDAHKPGP